MRSGRKQSPSEVLGNDLGVHDIHFHDHHGVPDEHEPPGGEGELPLTWGFDNVELLTVGVDIGSSTSHLLFARLHLQRLSHSLSSRFAVVRRDVLHRSPILLTPFREDGLIDVAALERFFEQAHQKADLTQQDIDTGAVILTGVALERPNARAVAELFASAGGKFVCAAAGHNLEAILAANGSGALALSRQRGDTLLHIDIGGGTSKLSLVRDGEVVETAAARVGGRLLAFDAEGRVVRIESGAQAVANSLGIRLDLGKPLPTGERQRISQALVDVLLDVMTGEPRSDLARNLLLTEPLSPAAATSAAVTCSGGVAEYIYGRESASFGDLSPYLADSLRGAAKTGRLRADLVPVGEGIRATVIGASQFTVQLSGNTVHISNPSRLPIRNLPVVHATLPSGPLEEQRVEAAIAHALRRLDLREGEEPVALALSWKGEPRYRALRALAGGIARALPKSLRAGFPLVIALQEDIGRSLGAILTEELGVTADIASIDGLQLMELDYIDVGELIQPANVVPVVIKSLAFPGAGGQMQL